MQGRRQWTTKRRVQERTITLTWTANSVWPDRRVTLRKNDGPTVLIDLQPFFLINKHVFTNLGLVETVDEAATMRQYARTLKLA